MKSSYVLSILVVAIQAACASENGSTSTTPSSNAGGAGSSAAGSSSATGGAGSSAAGSSSVTGGTGPITVVGGGLPDPGAATALSQNECYVGLKIPNVTYVNASCSASTTASGINALGPNAWNDYRLGVHISLNKPPAIGTLNLASLTITIPNGGVTLSWDAPVDACTATATDSVADTFMGRVYYSIGISCTKPAVPTTDPSLAPLTLDQFAIVTFFSA